MFVNWLFENFLEKASDQSGGLEEYMFRPRSPQFNDGACRRPPKVFEPVPTAAIKRPKVPITSISHRGFWIFDAFLFGENTTSNSLFLLSFSAIRFQIRALNMRSGGCKSRARESFVRKVDRVEGIVARHNDSPGVFVTDCMWVDNPRNLQRIRNNPTDIALFLFESDRLDL